MTDSIIAANRAMSNADDITKRLRSLVVDLADLVDDIVMADMGEGAEIIDRAGYTAYLEEFEDLKNYIESRFC